MKQVGLCGQVGECQRLCIRSCHCPLGRARAEHLLGQQRERRQLRRFVVGQAIEANVIRAAGSFTDFQCQLAWERSKGGYQCNTSYSEIEPRPSP